jgi:hypothetical protein
MMGEPQEVWCDGGVWGELLYETISPPGAHAPILVRNVHHHGPHE